MFQLIDLVTTAAASVYRSGAPDAEETLEVTWRRYGYDPDDLWYLEVDVVDDESATSQHVSLAKIG